MANKKYFEIDNKTKTFVFGPRTFQDLFVEDSDVNKAFKAAMALGCYEGYTPVQKPYNVKEDRNTDTQSFTCEGVVAWLTDNNPDWLKKWKASETVRMANNQKFPFMVRKNYFLFENPEARIYCGMKPDTADKKYELRAKGKALKRAVEARIAIEAQKKGEE